MEGGREEGQMNKTKIQIKCLYFITVSDWEQQTIENLEGGRKITQYNKDKTMAMSWMWIRE